VIVEFETRDRRRVDVLWRVEDVEIRARAWGVEERVLEVRVHFDKLVGDKAGRVRVQVVILQRFRVSESLLLVLLLLMSSEDEDKPEPESGPEPDPEVTGRFGLLEIETEFNEHRRIKSSWERPSSVEWMISERVMRGEEFGNVDEMMVFRFLEWRGIFSTLYSGFCIDW
jgi:hypothetical protein